jgi:hypothetical protein
MILKRMYDQNTQTQDILCLLSQGPTLFVGLTILNHVSLVELSCAAIIGSTN